MMNTDQLMTVARPYVEAIFSLGLEEKNLTAWGNFLNDASALTQDKLMQDLFYHPHINAAQLAQLYFDLLSSHQLTDSQRHFISLLAKNRRLIAIPAMAQLFRLREEEFNKTLTVTVRSVVPFDKVLQQKLIQKLSLKLHRKIELNCEMDPTLLGGAIVTAGDYVLDGSVRGKLMRLNEAVSRIF